MKKNAFTIVEMVMALAIFGILFSAIMTIYTRMISVKREFDARSYLLTTTYTMVEKLNILLKDYTIDYEEYFNRRMTGCAASGIMSGWNVGTSGNCTQFSAYGNYNGDARLALEGLDPDLHVLYACSSVNSYSDSTTHSFVYDDIMLLTGGGCFDVGGNQSYGQYRRQFIDVKENADETPSLIGDDDDTDMGRGPFAIIDNENIPELYLISKDKKSRLLLRRKLVQQNDANANGIYEPFERLYIIQMLQLRGFDAGSNHNFDPSDIDNKYMYDGQIDTWTCDYEKGFFCGSGVAINTLIYSGYNMPSTVDEGWVNLFGSDVTVSSWKMHIYPSKDPVYGWSEDDAQINPYIRLFMTTHLYAPSRYTKIDLKSMGNILYDLQTMFNIKSNY